MYDGLDKYVTHKVIGEESRGIPAPVSGTSGNLEAAEAKNIRVLVREEVKRQAHGSSAS